MLGCQRGVNIHYELEDYIFPHNNTIKQPTLVIDVRILHLAKDTIFCKLQIKGQ